MCIVEWEKVREEVGCKVCMVWGELVMIELVVKVFEDKWMCEIEEEEWKVWLYFVCFFVCMCDSISVMILIIMVVWKMFV